MVHTQNKNHKTLYNNMRVVFYTSLMKTGSIYLIYVSMTITMFISPLKMGYIFDDHTPDVIVKYRTGLRLEKKVWYSCTSEGPEPP